MNISKGIIYISVFFMLILVAYCSFNSSLKEERNIIQINNDIKNIDTLKPIKYENDTIIKELKDGVIIIDNHFDTISNHGLDSALQYFRDTKQL